MTEHNTPINKIDASSSPLISVIIPVYNTQEYLDFAVQSIVDQTYKNLDIMLIDDNSTDSSGMLCDAWKEKDSRIRVFHTEHAGAWHARNVGLDNMHGSYVTFADSDDYLDPQTIEILITNLLKYNAELSVARAMRVNSHSGLDNHNTHYQNCEIRELNTVSALKYVNTPGQFGYGCTAKLIYASLFRNLRFPQCDTGEDYPIVYELIRRSTTIVYDSRRLYKYFQRPNSLSKLLSIAPYTFTKTILNSIQQQYPECTPYALYKNITVGLGVYDAALVAKQHKHWIFLERDLHQTLKKHYTDIIHSVPLTKARIIQLSLFRFAPCLYRVLFPLYKKIHPELNY